MTLTVFLIAAGRGREIVRLVRERSVGRVSLMASLLLAGDWYCTIWAITNGEILAASLAYYLLPPLNVILGCIFLKERLRPLQVGAVLLALVAVVMMGVSIGGVPLLSTLNGTRVHSVRVPGFYSSAEIVFGLPGERLTIRHDSISYAPYVGGTLLAARRVDERIGVTRGLGSLLELDED